MGSLGVQRYTTKLYNLDMIISVGYRVKSKWNRNNSEFNNIFREKELDEKQTVAKNATVQIEGNKKVKRTIVYYI